MAATWGFAQIRHEVSVVNISVPVRVFDGEKFVDSLKLGDFEVYEDGKLQPVEAVYLIRGSEVQRQEGPAKAPAPATSRFEHKFVVLGPVGLFSDEAQRFHEYRIVGADGHVIPDERRLQGLQVLLGQGQDRDPEGRLGRPQSSGRPASLSWTRRNSSWASLNSFPL